MAVERDLTRRSCGMRLFFVFFCRFERQGFAVFWFGFTSFIGKIVGFCLGFYL